MLRLTDKQESVNSQEPRFSALAQLVAIHIERGIRSTAALAVVTGYCVRSIRSAKAELSRRGMPPEYAPLERQPAAEVGSPLPAAECRERQPSAGQAAAECRVSGPLPPQKKGLPHTPSKENSPLPPAHSFLSESGEGWENACRLIGGKLVLSAEEHADWVPRFGDAYRLELALGQAVAYVQVNSRRPLLVQVRAQLNSLARLKADSDERYRKRIENPPEDPRMVETRRLLAAYGGHAS